MRETCLLSLTGVRHVCMLDFLRRETCLLSLRNETWVPSQETRLLASVGHACSLLSRDRLARLYGDLRG